MSNASLYAVALLESRVNTSGAGDSVVILVANTANDPMMFSVTLGATGGASGSFLNYADHGVVLFHHRNRSLTQGTADDSGAEAGEVILTDMIEALGTKAYRVFLRPNDVSATQQPPRPNVNPKNVLLNPSFGATAA